MYKSKNKINASKRYKPLANELKERTKVMYDISTIYLVL